MIEIITLVATPIFRSVTGWLENSLEDKQIDTYEWSKLLSTVLRVGVIEVGLYYGLNAFGINVPVLGAAAAAFVTDLFFGALKKTEVVE